jgi:myo-inositol-1(or 4)-monophosphatase
MTDISASELSEIYKFAIQLGKDAGRMLLDGLERRRSGHGIPEDPIEKLNAVDIVTQTDNGEIQFWSYCSSLLPWVNWFD